MKRFFAYNIKIIELFFRLTRLKLLIHKVRSIFIQMRIYLGPCYKLFKGLMLNSKIFLIIEKYRNKVIEYSKTFR